MRPLARYLLFALAIVAIAILAISPLATSFVDQWAQRDIELRGQLVFNSVRDELTNLLVRGEAKPIDALFDRLALDERLLAVGFCDDSSSPCVIAAN
jgi:trehalose 6-phosphate synthase